jgi:hypothetical protein
VTAPQHDRRAGIGAQHPDRDHRNAWWALLGVALLPHLLLSVFLLYYWALEADPGYLVLYAWAELLLLPGGLLLGVILALARSSRRLAPAVFAGTFTGLLPVLAMVLLIAATS